MGTQNHNARGRKWAGTDLFEIDGKHYMLIVDYYSSFFEVNQLSSLSSERVIEVCKQHFARYGIPEIVISDNGTQYSSEQFRDFSEQYQFEHVTSSPHFPRSNGKAEKTVQIAKNLLKKAKREGSDPYLAILNYRNTPIDGLDASPAQMLMHRRTRTTLPTASKLLKPKVVPNVHENLKRKQETQKRYFDRGTKQLPLLKQGEKVKMRLPNKTWKDATVVTKSIFREAM